jgi:hypothetical protein
MNLLITFGCSWTQGSCVGYTSGMTESELKDIAQASEYTEKFSFRRILCDKLHLDHRNFATAGSSNQRQFRLARNFFVSDEFNELQQRYQKIIVLWGITATSRNEFFNAQSQQFENVMFGPDSEDWELTNYFIKHSYDHANEVAELASNIAHWNQYFNSVGVINFWFDTFNHHDYAQPSYALQEQKTRYLELSGSTWPQWEDFISRRYTKLPEDLLQFDFIEYLPPAVPLNLFKHDQLSRDLLSQLNVINGNTQFDSSYHKSFWKISDSNRINFLINKGILNPISHHPTKVGHEQIANLLEPLLCSVRLEA